MASRRRRRSVTWFPTIGTAGTEGSDDNASGRQFQLNVALDATTDVQITQLTFDEPRDNDQDSVGDTTMADYIGSEYMLRRIVGKLFAAYIGGASSAPAALFGAGFFVARANDAGQGEDQPIGSQTPSERRENYNPLSDDCIREPWIWRRTYVLGNGPRQGGAGNGAVAGGVAQFPITTAGYGSVWDGPHIDAQTMRRVSSDERLWFAIAARAFPIAIPEEVDSNVFGYLDYRLLGSLMKARNRGVF